AIAANGVGAVYDLATGRRLADIGAFRGLYFASRQEAFWLQPAVPDSPATVSHWTSAPSASTGAAWKAGKFAELVPGAVAFIEYSFYSQHGSEHPSFNLSGEIPFQLRGLDPATGRELWKHVYLSDPPVPFNDPQGDRLVLGWKAKAPGAWESAKHSPAARELLKRQKLKDLDAFFEVLDSRTGNSLGGVLVQFGSGASSFDSAFSCGDALLLVKDRYRVTLFDLRTGTQLARLRGQHPAASAAAKILALDEGGKLVFYDLASGARLGQRRFSDGIAYFRFAEKGDRFFVLANHQQFFLLDVKKLLDDSAKSPSEDH
ncbi:MAG TPA: hypothetical protein VM781_01805, partial [Candidatus Bathyarchaeia archaeon]|nr:hypothetical protein [Candidatus Bathyarchaeia archaeon]